MVPISRELIQELNKEAPGSVIVTTVCAAWMMLLGIPWIVLGICLIKVQSWARWCAVLLAMITPLPVIAGVIYELGIVRPAIERAQATLLKRHPGLVKKNNAGYETGQVIGIVSRGLVVSAICLTVIICLLVPSAGRAFTDRPEPRRYEDDRWEGRRSRRDYDEEDDWEDRDDRDRGPRYRERR
jgi:hypothetical protein